MSLEDLFCDVDEFCQVFLPAWHRQLLMEGTRQRRRASYLTLGEIMTILLYFHQTRYRNFKAFHLLPVCPHCRGEFPNLLSDNRFVALISTALMPLARPGHRDCLRRCHLAGGLPQPPDSQPPGVQAGGPPRQNLHGLVLRLQAPSRRQ